MATKRKATKRKASPKRKATKRKASPKRHAVKAHGGGGR